MNGDENDCDDGDDDDEDEDEDEEDEHYISKDEHMFHAPYDAKTCEHCYTGNDGGEEETWYYAAAIVISHP